MKATGPMGNAAMKRAVLLMGQTPRLLQERGYKVVCAINIIADIRQMMRQAAAFQIFAKRLGVKGFGRVVVVLRVELVYDKRVNARSQNVRQWFGRATCTCIASRNQRFIDHPPLHATYLIANALVVLITQSLILADSLSKKELLTHDSIGLALR